LVARPLTRRNLENERREVRVLGILFGAFSGLLVGFFVGLMAPGVLFGVGGAWVVAVAFIGAFVGLIDGAAVVRLTRREYDDAT
jgi:uncharacterized membrane protein YjjP (DUF1212 family)